MKRISIAPICNIPENSGKAFDVQGHKIAIFHVDGQFYALDDTCSHADASLGEGEIDEDLLCVECPRHGARFNLKTGQAETLPAYKPVATYPVVVQGNDLVVELPET